MVFLLMMLHEQYDVKLISEDNPKLQMLCQSLHRKGLITAEYKITETGTKLLEYLKAKTRQKFVKPKISAQEFDDWWEAKRAAFGGDDGVEFIPLAGVEKSLELNPKFPDFVIMMTPKSMRF